jgi:cell division protein FtsZ
MAARAPAPVQPQQEEEAPLFPDSPYGSADRRKGGWLGLFGGRNGGGRAGYEQPQQPTYRQASAPVTTSRGGAATAAQVQESEPLDASDDLDIPSFLRRLAN